MNIFYLSTDPIKAAQYHCDKHVVKMILETAQLLSVAQRVGGNDSEILYKGFPNHPSTKWTAASIYNYEWLLDLFVALSDEYTYRYGKVHKSYEKLGYELTKVPNLPKIKFTPPPQCMPDYCKCENTVEAYRTYYVYEKAYMCKWTKREVPEWYYEWIS